MCKRSRFVRVVLSGGGGHGRNTREGPSADFFKCAKQEWNHPRPPCPRVGGVQPSAPHKKHPRRRVCPRWVVSSKVSLSPLNWTEGSDCCNRRAFRNGSGQLNIDLVGDRGPVVVHKCLFCVFPRKIYFPPLFHTTSGSCTNSAVKTNLSHTYPHSGNAMGEILLFLDMGPARRTANSHLKVAGFFWKHYKDEPTSHTLCILVHIQNPKLNCFPKKKCTGKHLSGTKHVTPDPAVRRSDVTDYLMTLLRRGNSGMQPERVFELWTQSGRSLCQSLRLEFFSPNSPTGNVSLMYVVLRCLALGG